MNVLRLLSHKGKACSSEYKSPLPVRPAIYDFICGSNISKVLDSLIHHTGQRRFNEWVY